MPEFLYGHWAVMEALRANRRSNEQLLVADTADDKGIIRDILQTAEEQNIPVRRVQKGIINDLAKGKNHQSVVLRTGEYPYVDLMEILDFAKERGEKPFILLLDLLQDPQNVGSLIRISDAVGIHGVVMQDRRGVSVTPAVVSASSGAVEHIKVAQVTNLVQSMKTLKENDVWIVGLDLGPNVPTIDKTDLNMSIGLVMGSEGEGMRRLVRDTCDLRVTLPMRGNVGSLNVATAGAVALYSAWQARNWEGWVHA